jgi:V/A-type H+/Na+-transporting ATPase subunit K
MDDPARKLKAQIKQSIVVLLTILAIVGTVFCSNAMAVEAPGGEAGLESVTTSAEAGVIKFGLMAAAIAFGLGALGAGFAISHVGAAAMGAVAEKPQIAGQALIFVALAEGIVVFGFITALMILGKV